MIPELGLSLSVRRESGAAIIVARGELDFASVDELRDAALRARPGCRRMVLDFRQLTFIDSSGLGTLLNLAGECRRAGVSFCVECADGPVRRALETTGLSELLAA